MADVLVVGGGIIGLSIARELRRAGRSVTLLDRGQPGREASWASAGIVPARAFWASQGAATLQSLSAALWPRLAEELRDESGMDVEYRETGCLYPAFAPAEASRMAAETRALRSAGLEFSFVEGAALREAEPGLGPAVIAAQLGPGGNVENRRVCRALEIALRRSGVEVVSGAQVTRVATRGSRVVGVDTLEGHWPAEVVVIAAGSWSGTIPGAEPRLPIVPQRGQILALGATATPLRHTVLKTHDPYLVPRADGRIVVGATREMAGYDRSLTAGGVAWLLSSAIEMVPALAAASIVEMWTGFRPLSPDGVPVIGPGALEGLFYATGHGPSGVGPAPGTAALLAALILGAEPPIPAAPFRADRFAGASS